MLLNVYLINVYCFLSQLLGWRATKMNAKSSKMLQFNFQGSHVGLRNIRGIEASFNLSTLKGVC